jgi:hypothetical protein
LNKRRYHKYTISPVNYLPVILITKYSRVCNEYVAHAVHIV